MDQEFLGGGGAGEATHRAAGELEPIRDASDRLPIVEQGVHGGVALPRSDRDPVCPLTRDRPSRYCGCTVGPLEVAIRGRAGCGFDARLGAGPAVTTRAVLSWVVLGVDRGGQAGAVAGDGAFDGVGEVVPRVPPIRYLQCVRGAGPGAFGVGAGPVPADDLDARMISEPRGQGRGGAIG